MTGGERIAARPAARRSCRAAPSRLPVSSARSSVVCLRERCVIEFRCSKCDGVVRAPEAHAGKKGRCPTCQEVVPIPEKSERLEPVEFPCEKCGHGMKAPGKFVGRQGKCAKCGHLMTIPAESVPHGGPLPVAKPVAKAPSAAPSNIVQAKPVQATPVRPAVAKPAQPASPKPAQPAAAKPSQGAVAPNPFAQPHAAAPGPAAQPHPFAQPQPKPAAQPNAFAQPQPAAKPRPVVAASDPFADLGNLGAPAMAPMPMTPAMPAHGAYAAPAHYGAPRPSGGSADVPGIISMILGIVSILLMMGGCVLSCIPIIGGLFNLLAFLTSAGGLITGFFGKSGFRVAGIIMNAIVLFILVMLMVIGIILVLTVGLSEFNNQGMQPDPWADSYESDFGDDF
jgi:hypothetical protein